jgi:hypothetical protein
MKIKKTGLDGWYFSDHFHSARLIESVSLIYKTGERTSDFFVELIPKGKLSDDEWREALRGYPEYPRPTTFCE